MNWREGALWAFLFALLFGVGWFRGAHPDFHWQDYFSSSKPLVILTPNRDWLPESFVQRLSKEIDQEIRIEVVEDFADFEARLIPMDSPPLLWMPSSWAEALGSQGLLTELAPQSPWVRDQVSADFIQPVTARLFFVPLLWDVEDQSLRVEGVAIPHGGENRAAALAALRKWLKPTVALAHVRDVPEAATTVLSLEEKNLPHEKRASSLRDFNFKTLKIR
ncbi:MAG: hypothetical protein KF802_00995 [Bdellovibrionaceae bacterium]|nr:hypothetical protein [Pseudobdellovibrionaceae bacterium]MBX3034296.1 hypothetical protein [Pseudobdellovibrionaceae bacterium]